MLEPTKSMFCKGTVSDVCWWGKLDTVPALVDAAMVASLLAALVTAPGAQGQDGQDSQDKKRRGSKKEN